MKAVLRVWLPFLPFMLALGCGGDGGSPEAGQGPSIGGDASGECTDVDGDGFGANCTDGPDCDDQDDTVFENCSAA